MKTTLNVLLLVLAAILPAATFAGLVGILPPVAFVASEVTLFVFAFVGLMLIGLNDHGYGRRPVIVRRSLPAVRPCLIASPAPRRSSYGLRSRECPVA
jgi:hypothetical protein